MKVYVEEGESRQDDYKHKRLDWLVYLPGAIIFCYGLWLAVTPQ